MENPFKNTTDEYLLLDIKGFLWELDDKQKYIDRLKNRIKTHTDELKSRGVAIPPTMRSALNIHSVSIFVCPECGSLNTKALVGVVTIQCNECNHVWANEC